MKQTKVNTIKNRINVINKANAFFRNVMMSSICILFFIAIINLSTAYNVVIGSIILAWVILSYYFYLKKLKENTIDEGILDALDK